MQERYINPEFAAAYKERRASKKKMQGRHPFGGTSKKEFQRALKALGIDGSTALAEVLDVKELTARKYHAHPNMLSYENALKLRERQLTIRNDMLDNILEQAAGPRGLVTSRQWQEVAEFDKATRCIAVYSSEKPYSEALVDELHSRILVHGLQLLSRREDKSHVLRTLELLLSDRLRESEKMLRFHKEKVEELKDADNTADEEFIFAVKAENGCSRYVEEVRGELSRLHYLLNMDKDKTTADELERMLASELTGLSEGDIVAQGISEEALDAYTVRR